MADKLKIKKGDFIEVDFTGKISSTGQVFDTTLEPVAKESGIFNKEIKYKPIIISIGEGHILNAIDDFIEGKDLGKYTLELPAEKAFGKKDAKLLRLIALKEFHKHQIQPHPGLDVDLDGKRGVVRTVNGGRVIVDFNHPLSSKDITYDLVLNKVIEDEKDKVESILKVLQIPYETFTFAEGIATIKLAQKFPDELTVPIKEQIIKLTKIKDVIFE